MLYVFDLRKQEMGQRADRFFSPKSGTDLVWLSAVTKYIIDQGWQDQAFIDKWVNNFEVYKKSLEPFTLAYAEELTGISVADLKAIAKEIASVDKLAICWAMEIGRASCRERVSKL